MDTIAMNNKIMLLVDMPDGSKVHLNIEYNAAELAANTRNVNICSSGYSLCDAIAEYIGGEFGAAREVNMSKAS